MLSRHCGWTSKDFLPLTPDQRQEFWRQANATSSNESLKALLTETIVQSQTDVARATLGGDYLPLGVWKAKGFDTEEIEAKCTDTMEHPIFGKVYRVQIFGLSREGLKETTQRTIQEKVDRRKPKLPKKLNLPLSDAQGFPEEEPEMEEHNSAEASSSKSSESSSSSSSSRSRKKKKKKSKKSKRSKKSKAKRKPGKRGSDRAGPYKKELVTMRAAERKLEQEQKRIELKATKEKETQNKAQAAFLRKLIADSQKSLTATYPVLLQLTTTQKEPEFLELSKELQDGINASASALTTIKVEAQATTKHPFTYFSCVFQM
jgi:hypothetical protein